MHCCILVYKRSNEDREEVWQFLALYLKQAASSLQIAYGGGYTKPELLPVPISLTRSGIPTIIPPFHRQIIRSGGDRADPLVRMYLSFFSLNKLIQRAKKVSVSTLKPIVDPWDDPGRRGAPLFDFLFDAFFPPLPSPHSWPRHSHFEVLHLG